MDNRGQGRYDRSRYVSGADKGRPSGRYHDHFFDDMRMPEDDADAHRSFSSRLKADDPEAPRRSARRTRFLPDDELEGAPETGEAAGAGADSALSHDAEGVSPEEAAIGSLYPSAQGGEGGEDAEDAEERHPRRDFSRKAVEDRVASTAPARRRNTKRIGIVVGAVLAVVVLVGAGVGLAYVSGIAGNLHAGVDDDLRAALVETDMANEPFYILLLGTDGSSERDGDPGFGGVYRSDSIMLARVDPVGKKATLVSIGRDIVVDLGGDYGEEKINSAYAIGGPAKAVEAVSKLAGVPISHYAQVDFDGFAAMVDALGGVEVDVPMSFSDEDAGGSLEAGYQTLDGAQALMLCRMRGAYAAVSAQPDAMRAANQRLVLSAIAKKLLASDVATIAATVQAMSAYVTTDLELTDIIGLAQVMKGIDSDTDIYTASVPTTSQYVDGGWYDFVEKDEWAEMMKRIDAGEPPVDEAIVDEATGTVLATAGEGTSSTAEKYAVVTVKNATDTAGLATQVRSKLMDAGFVNVVVGDITDSFDYPDTLVVYDEPGRAREAEEIVNAIGQGKAMENDGSYLLLDTDFVVVIGEDWRQ